MWVAIGVLSLLASVVALVFGIVKAVKKDPVFKKWLIATGVLFVLFIVSVSNSPTSATQPTSQIKAKPTESTVKKATPINPASALSQFLMLLA